MIADIEQLRRLALKWLARRDYSAQELLTKLERVSIDPSLIEDAMTGLRQEGWVNDECFTENYIYARQQKGFGPYRILMELESKGIDQTILQRLLHPNDPIWHQAIHHVYQKYFVKNPMKRHNPQQQIRFLLQRGFGEEHVELIIRKLADEKLEG